MTDIIDNRNLELAEVITERLGHSRAAHFAVGYFFLSGFEIIRPQLAGLEQLRLLIGATTNRQTVEQLAEGYRRRELIEQAMARDNHASKDQLAAMMQATGDNVQSSIGRMEQNDSQAALIETVAGMIEQGRLQVRVYTKERLHAKAYIFDHKAEVMNKGSGIIGSSNLSLSGIKANTELNVLVEGNNNHAQISAWFEELWNVGQPFDKELMQLLQDSWAMRPVNPYDIYIKTLYELVKDRLREPEREPYSWPIPLLEFQRVAVAQGLQILKDYNGVFISDVVGLGKTYIGLAMLYYLTKYERQTALVICPAPLVAMWEELLDKYELAGMVKVISQGRLREGKVQLEKDYQYKNREVVLIDESHNFRNSDTQRYITLQPYLARRRAILLTATPQANEVHDIYNQIKLFHPEDRTDIPIEPATLTAYFKAVERGSRSLPDLLRHLLIRRTRKHIVRYYQNATFKGKPLQFPTRELEAVRYDIDAVYAARYEELRKAISVRLCYAKYRLYDYVQPAYRDMQPYLGLRQSGGNLRGLMRTLLFKRLESSIYAFRESIKRLIDLHEAFIGALDLGLVAAGQDAQKLLYEDVEDSELYEQLARLGQRYNAKAFALDALLHDIEADLAVLRDMHTLVADIGPQEDAKLRRLQELMAGEAIGKEKVLLFTQYADTANYLRDNLDLADMYQIDATTTNRLELIGRFAPEANNYTLGAHERPIRVLLSTDVLSEGLNLQDARYIINYDLHWNPVRLIQRVGRVDRIGSAYDKIYAYNFLPERAVEKNLGLEERLRQRIREIHDTIGEDNAILDPNEQVNDAAMYAIYRGDTAVLDDEPADEVAIDLTEAEEQLRALKRDNPEYYNLIAKMPDGLRSARTSEGLHGSLAFAEVGRTQMFFLAQIDGSIRQLTTQEALLALHCATEEPQRTMPKTHNVAVTSIQRRLDDEASRIAEQQRSNPKLTLGQNYASKQLEQRYRELEDEDERGQLERLIRLLRQPLPRIVTRELNTLRRQGLKGDELLNHVVNIVIENSLAEMYEQQQRAAREPVIPRLIISEALV